MKTRSQKALPVGSRTDVGQIREHNEDSLLVKPPLYVVADGMGGHAAGEVASELAIRTFEEAAITTADPEALERAVAESNSAIIRGAREGLGRAGMGTTLTAAVIEDDRLLVAQIGDSRAYLLQKGQLRQITRDHSVVAELISSGQITREEARTHPDRSVITRALGSDPHVRPDIYEMRLHAGERLMLCSDGLTGMLNTATLQNILTENPDPQQAADALIDAANNAGGHDNITAIVVDVSEVDPQAEKRQKRRFTWGIAVFLLVFVLLVAGAIGGLYAYARNAFFLIDEGGQVTLYRGLPGETMGVRLQWFEEQTNIPVASLPPTTASELEEGIQTSSFDEAKTIIANYREHYEKQSKSSQ
ncbi:MAG: Stp1/IreP family PP2C-type Ser/Thr phosphatase [Coriobacteriales bacterium]|jgi:protein phosphatase|nr:Stp1/IreP family PP2C-type Ser/Thr phosphatase [Coriobacteriales bacterium]